MFCCVLQAVIHQETTDNYQRLFRLFTEIVSQLWSMTEDQVINLVTQVHKDLHDGAEAARELRFPTARACDDLTHVMARFGVQLPGKCGQTLPTPSATPPLGPPAPPQDRLCTAFSLKGDRLKECLRALFLHCPTVDILDVMLGRFLQEVEASAPGAAKYLWREKYAQRVTREQLQRWNIHPRSHTQAEFIFASAWQGLFGQHPGTHCGSQPVEAFHARWEGILANIGGPASNAAVLHKLQDLYRQPLYVTQHHLATDMSLQAPRDAVRDFLSGAVMHAIGLSCAVDYVTASEAPCQHGRTPAQSRA